ncbi:SGNH/GDSL hydrolase family protein [Companilactobacillus ginsenosidimutans]|uniref:SGNH hydrolase-type esterase domain-containing protein n=1 Tax=Companilactobacillus ginsenosidimutans TaxID=1007676 RepID=A0A0H4QKM4_9LACO|nr:SGNH/GDSL hydrolase family protein [Companilactobacillus ginsenosidimutans]AKP68442.1 hypothetical protein ABM34_08045 [Companilactobacillus ginsenosidimutans]
MSKARWLSLLAFLLMFVLVTGCSSKQSSSKHSSPKTEQKKTVKKTKPTKKTLATELKDSPKKTLVYSPLGDSLSVGLLADSKENRFSSQFTRTIAKETGKKVTEEGASSVGKTATNFGLPNVNTIIAQKPDIITVEFGTNDAADVTNPKALPAYQNSIHQILDQLQSQTKAKIILMTTWSPSNGDYVQNDLRFDKVVIKEGKDRNLPVVNLSKIWQGNPNVTGSTNNTSYNVWGSKDDFHPNQAGHDQIAKALTKVLNQEIK